MMVTTFNRLLSIFKDNNLVCMRMVFKRWAMTKLVLPTNCLHGMLVLLSSLHLRLKLFIEMNLDLSMSSMIEINCFCPVEMSVNIDKGIVIRQTFDIVVNGLPLAATNHFLITSGTPNGYCLECSAK